jgi:hypothetical protein
MRLQVDRVNTPTIIILPVKLKVTPSNCPEQDQWNGIQLSENKSNFSKGVLFAMYSEGQFI